VFILPELYCLYQQFDLHPEKVVFGQTGVSGIGFFFWGSQFGRFFNTGPIKGSGDPTFFIHTTLWAFLPWSLLLFAAVFQSIKKGIKNVQAHEWYCLCGALLTFLVFSASKFQLPFYTNIIYPFFAIITAQYLFNVQAVKSLKAIRITQVTVIILVMIVLGALEYIFAPGYFKWPVITLICLLYVVMVFLPDAVSEQSLQKLLLATAVASFIVNVYLNLAFYPSLLRYQGGSMAAEWINNYNNTTNYPVIQCEENNWPMEFYLNGTLRTVIPDTAKNAPAGTCLLYASPDALKKLHANGWSYFPVYHVNNYPVTRLKMPFLNARIRRKALTSMEIVMVNPPSPHITFDTTSVRKKNSSAAKKLKLIR
jgi:hypothetical protein